MVTVNLLEGHRCLVRAREAAVNVLHDLHSGCVLCDDVYHRLRPRRLGVNDLYVQLDGLLHQQPSRAGQLRQTPVSCTDPPQDCAA